MLHGCLFLRQYQGHVAPDLTYMNATLKQHPCHTNSNPGSEAREKPWKNPSSEHTLKIGRRNSGADSIGMKQVPREPGCDTSSQPASEDAAGIYLECCRLWSRRSLDGKQVLPVSSEDTFKAGQLARMASTPRFHSFSLLMLYIVSFVKS